jgi:predicted Zn-dependent peptidase
MIIRIITETKGGLTITRMESDSYVRNLKNGSKMLIKDMPFLRTVTLGIGVNVGAANENVDNSGISHLIEHTVFKRTKNFDGYKLKKIIESVGGTLNAFTSREYTLFYAKVPDFASKEAFDVIYDLVSAPLFLEEDVEMEKNVVLEEIAMYEDDPMDLAGTNLLKALWGENSPYGQPIIGKAEIVKNLRSEDLKRYHQFHYVPSKMTLSVVGNVAACDMETFTEKMENLEGNFENVAAADPKSMDPTNVVVAKRDLKQVNVSLAVPTVDKSDPRNYDLAIIATILGGGMSSMLFEELREKRGLVYSISSSNQTNKLSGYFSIDFSTSPQKVFEATERIEKVLSTFPRNVHSYIDYGKKRLEGKLLTSTESTFSTMLMMTDDQFTLGRVRKIEETIDTLNRVDEKDILHTFGDLMCRRWTLSAVGPEGEYVETLKKHEFEVNFDGSN